MILAHAANPDGSNFRKGQRWNVGEPRIDLAARQLMTQNDRAFVVATDDMERVLADVDADLAMTLVLEVARGMGCS